jgi:flagellar basal body-associated protein FliL
MAKAAEHADEHAAGGEPAPKAGGSMMGRLLVIVLVMVVVGVECVVAYLCIPPAQTQAGGEGAGLPKSTAEKKKELVEPELQPGVESEKMIEVDLGEFSVTVFNAASNSTMRFDFKVVGTIENKEKKDYDELYEKHKQRVREQITTTIRSAEMADLIDPSLSVIKRSIQEKARQTLGRPLLKDILIPDFSFIEN